MWMTEVSHGGVDPMSDEALLGRAVHIHDELTITGASAYFGMANMWDSVSHHEHFGNDDLFKEEGHIALIDVSAERVHLTGIAYAIGHYARWVEPGARRIHVDSDNLQVLVTAFLNPKSAVPVVIMINAMDSEATTKIYTPGSWNELSWRGEQSSSKSRWEPLESAVKVYQGQITLTLPPRSVTSVGAQE